MCKGGEARGARRGRDKTKRCGITRLGDLATRHQWEVEED